MKTTKIIPFLAMMLFLFPQKTFAASPEEKSPEEESPGKQLVRGLVRGLNEINEKDQTAESLVQDYTELVEKYFSISFLFRFTVGSKNIKKLSAEEQETFKTTFTEVLVHKFLNIIGNECGEVQIDESHIKFGKESKRKNQRTSRTHYSVKTSISLSQKSAPLQVEWKIVETKNNQNQSEYYLYDIVFEGISQLISMKSEYKSLIRRKGLQGFISSMEEFVERRSQALEKACLN